MTPAGKLYNWNILTDLFKTVDVKLEQDVKSLIIAGDLDMMNEVLRLIYRNCGEYVLRRRE